MCPKAVAGGRWPELWQPRKHCERVGRKPLVTGHVDTLAGSTRAKDRLRVFLETLRGELTVPKACEELALSESQFHWARGQWLQEALELLESRPLGRPKQQPD